MTLDDIVSSFNTTPFLFVGSGLTRRYLGLPDWETLLKHFANIALNDEFSYSYYTNKALAMGYTAGLMPKIAELIQEDFNEKWFSTPSIRTSDTNIQSFVKLGVSPFKAEIAAYIKSHTDINSAYKEEIQKLSTISVKSISGVITTNYDTFLEDNFEGYTKYVGQEQLIFSAIQGIAEIYKIHGSIELPESIIIHEKDYLKFNEKSEYLAAKLMTIFMEYPIIFLGYSISDNNIQKIIKSIVNCLDKNQVKLLENRFVFVEYKKGIMGVEISPYTIMIDNKPLTMRKITLEDFMLLYCALDQKKAKLPVKILRRFKQELYTYTITNMPTSNLRVASIDDSRIDDDELVLAIGRVSQLGLKGLSGIDSNEWYRNIILEDLEFTSDELLQYAYPKLIKQNSWRLPVNKYLSSAQNDFPDCQALARTQNFDVIISETIKRNRRCLGKYTSVMQIWNQEHDSIDKATRLISHLEEDQIDVNELEIVLKELFEEDANILQNVPSSTRTHIRRLIMLYDYLKWGK